MKLRLLLYIQLLSMILLCSCIDVIELNLDSSEVDRQLLIDGEVATGSGPFELRVSYVEGFGLGDQVPIGNAEATLVDSDGNKASYENLGEGSYRIKENEFVVKEGLSYHIELKIGEKTYKSIPEFPPRSIPVERIYFEINNRSSTGSESEGILRRVVDVRIDLNIPEEASELYLRWTVQDAWSLLETQQPSNGPGPPPPAKVCYFEDNPNPQDIFLLDASRLRAGPLTEQLVAYRILDESFHIRHVFRVEQRTISRQAYEYWENIRTVNNQNGSIFDIPPASVNGNIFNTQNQNEIVLGYFGVVSSTIARLEINKNELGAIRIDPPCRLFWFNYNAGLGEFVPGFCFNCLLLEKSTLERPDYY